MITTYRRVLSLPGALAFSLSGLVARLPISMVSLGIVLLVSTRTGSYGLAGAVSASYLIANAVFAVRPGPARRPARPAPGAAADDPGVRRRAGPADGGGGVVLGRPLPPALRRSLAGAALPQIGSCVRARWSLVVRDRSLLQTAFAFEAVVDETVFMVGPTLVTLLATAVHPLAGLARRAAGRRRGHAGAGRAAADRATRAPAAPRPRAAPRPAVAAAGAAGRRGGGDGRAVRRREVATVAFAEELGTKAASGPLLAVWALGSLLSGLVTGALTWRAHIGTRFRWGMLAPGRVDGPAAVRRRVRPRWWRSSSSPASRSPPR